MRISIVVPACNEETRIGRMLDAYLPHFSARYGDDVEFLVVVNGSSDRTEAIVRQYGARYAQVRCLVEPGRVGKGGALMLGFRAARGDWVGFVDADGSTLPDAFEALVTHIGDAGAVIASRWRPDSVVSPRQPLLRRLTSRMFNFMTRTLFGLRLTDTQCGAKLMRRDALAAVLPHLGITRWAFDVDLLFHLRSAGYEIREIPTTWCDVPGSKVMIIQTSMEMFAAVIRLRMVYSPLRWVVGLYDRYVGPSINPPGFDEHRLFWQGLVPLAGSQAANLFNLLFQVAMARMLSDRDYGVMATVLGLIGIAGAFAGALAGSVARFTGEAEAACGREGVAALLRRVSRDLFWLSLLACAAAWGTGPWIAAFFRLENAGPLLVGLAVIVAMTCMGMAGGALVGCRAYVWGTAIGALWSAVRALMAAALVWAGWGAVGALSAEGLGCVAALVLGGVALRQVVGPGRSGASVWPGFYLACATALITALGYAVLMNAPVLIVKHCFPGDQAGGFAKAAMVARAVVFLSLPLAGALMPKVAAVGVASPAGLTTLRRAMALIALITLAATLLCNLFPAAFLRILTGSAAGESSSILRAITWAIAPLSLVYVLMTFEIGRQRYVIGGVLLTCAAAFLGGAALWHGTIRQIVTGLGVANWTALAVSVLCVPWKPRVSAARG